jgi:stage III sporulation protein AG
MLKSWWKRLSGETENADEQDDSYRNRPRTLQWLVILGCVGVALMLFSSFISVRQEVIPAREPPSETGEAAETSALSDDGRPLSIEDYEDKMAAELSGLLEKVVGLEQVSVQVNLKSTEIAVLEKNTVNKKQVTEEEDREGGKRTVTDTNEDRQVVTIQGKQGEEPIVVQRLKPDVKGIMIVAKGVENLEVKSAVLQAVRAYLDVPPHKIAILPKG